MLVGCSGAPYYGEADGEYTDVAHQSYDWKVGARLAAVTERLRKTAPYST